MTQHSADPARVAMLVDKFLAHEKSLAAKRATSPPKPPSVTTESSTPTRTTTPISSTPTAPTTTKTTEGEKNMPIRRPKTAAKHRSPKPPKKSKGYTVEIAADALEPPETWTQPTYTTDTPRTRSAHGVEGMTPCYTCRGPCAPSEARHGPWRRHERCTRISQPWQRVRAAAEHFSLPVSDDEARAAAVVVPAYGERHVGATYTDAEPVAGPWSHVSLAEVAKGLLIARQRISEARTPLACDLGRCGWCGVEKALTWTSYGHRWPDGAEAPLCDGCSVVYVRRGYPSPNYPDDARLALVEALTGVPPSMGDSAPAALRAFHEVGHGGDGEPWDFLPAAAVEALRWNRWARSNGKYAPVEHRAEAVERRRAREADRAGRVAALQSPDVFGFNSAVSAVETEVDDDA